MNVYGVCVYLLLMDLLTVIQDLGTDDDDGQITWKQQLCLSHVRLRSTSVAVLEVNRKVPEGNAAQQGQANPSGVEVIAWAFTKIMQVPGLPKIDRIWFRG